jgi:hypothetical protein
VNIIQVCHERDDALGPFGVATRAAVWGNGNRETSEEALALVAEGGSALEALYASYDPSHVRGALLEGFVARHLRLDYGDLSVVDNAFLTIETGERTYRSEDNSISWDGSIDVAAWSVPRARGECHDCKVRASEINVEVLRELEKNLPDPEFRLGVVTTNSYLAALTKLKAKGYQPGPRCKLISMEKLWDFTPLWRAALRS